MIAALALSLSLSAAEPVKQLNAAIDLFDQLNDEAAQAKLQALLAQHPRGAIAAKAHLYLGLIALNQGNPDIVRTEFKSALEANPAIELPPRVSPKAKLSFFQARAEFEKDIATIKVPQQQEVATPAPLAAVVAPPEEPATNYHIASWVLIAVGVGAVATAVVGGVQVLSYNSQASGAKAGQTKMSDLISSYDSASFWSKAWLPFAIGGAAAGGAAAFVW